MMKKLLLGCLALLSTLAVSAQSFITESGSSDTISMAYTGSGDLAIYNKLKATGPNVNLKWSVIESDIPTGWTMTGFCDNITCYTANNVLSGTIHTTDAITNAAFADFHWLINGSAAPNGSMAYVTVRVRDTADGTTRNLTFICYKAAASVAGMSTLQNGISLYPMPAREVLNVNFDSQAGVRVAAIYNLIGKAVSVYRVQGNSAKLDLSALPAGMYLLRLSNSKGDVVATRKFTRQ